MLASHDLTGAAGAPRRHSSSDSHSALIAEIVELRRKQALLLDACEEANRIAEDWIGNFGGPDEILRVLRAAIAMVQP